MADTKFVVSAKTGIQKSVKLNADEQAERDKFVKDWNDGATDRAWADIRKRRNLLLLESDWMATSDRTISDEEKAYRTQLRDFPSTIADPTAEVDWPEHP